MKEYVNIWRDTFMFMDYNDWRLDIVKVSIVTKWRFRLNEIPVNTPPCFFVKIGTVIPVSLGKRSGPRIARTILRKKKWCVYTIILRLIIKLQ